MSSFLSTSSLGGLTVAPIAVPQVEVPAGSNGLPIAEFQIFPGQSFNICHVCLHFIGFKTLGYLGKVNTGLPAVFVGAYFQTRGFSGAKSGLPIWSVGSNIPGEAVQPSVQGVTFSAPGVYRFVLVNNSASSTVRALVTGCAQLFNIN